MWRVDVQKFCLVRSHRINPRPKASISKLGNSVLEMRIRALGAKCIDVQSLGHLVDTCWKAKVMLPLPDLNDLESATWTLVVMSGN